MYHKLAIALLVGWLMGIGTLLSAITMSGGLSRVEYIASIEQLGPMLARGCEPVAAPPTRFYRCPRLHLP